MFKKLDNPVWNALHEVHQPLAQTIDTTLFYPFDLCPFGAFENDLPEIQNHLQSPKMNSFFIVGPSAKTIDSRLTLVNRLECRQMVLEKEIDLTITENIVHLNNQFETELLELVQHVQPGYFFEKTSQLGNYYGIFKDKQLVAVTGERMRMNAFTEISAVVTHPNYVGQGLAKQLVAHAANTILKQNKTPFLHVAASNVNAIYLYEKLQFTHRKNINFWQYNHK